MEIKGALIQILEEMFHIQFLSRNVSGDELESLRKTVWLVGWILISRTIQFLSRTFCG